MKSMEYFAQEHKYVVEQFHSDPIKGISETEAKKRLAQYGLNVLIRNDSQTWWKIFTEQFISPVIWVLLGAGGLALLFDKTLEGLAIIIVVAINVSISFFMEWQATRSMASLKKMGRFTTKVVRQGLLREVDSAKLVPGDLIRLDAGDLVTADARLIEVHHLSVMEAELTGESFHIVKQVDPLPSGTILAERNNMVFKGTFVVNGNGFALVIATGENTELGKIAELTQEAKKEVTPFNKRLNQLARQLSWFTLIIVVLIFIIGISRGSNWITMIETALALAVAVFPEGLPVIATITLARGMIRLSKEKAIVKTMEAVQTLGETNIILTDKTGTLTENQLQLETIITLQSTQSFSPSPHKPDKSDLPKAITELLRVGVLCNDSTYDSNHSPLGDPIEVAILDRAADLLGDPLKIKEHYPRIKEIPFEANKKLMATINRDNGKYLICVKGAAEVVIKKCTHMLDAIGEKVPLVNQPDWLQRSDKLSSSGLRVLSFAYRITNTEPDTNDFLHDLVFLGLGGFIDNARQGVKEALSACKNAGVKVIMLTGDHPDTAGYIAEKVGLVDDRNKAITIHGRDLNPLFNNKNAGSKIHDVDIFARINPAQKLDLVRLYQQNHYIVAMTGDGVNDAPALRKADIGIAMGLRGTEVAKEAADIILKDDSFASIVLAIHQGRVIFNNIRKFVIYLLSCNLGEMMVVGTATLLGIPLPLLPLQILFLNFVTDIFPALAIGMNKGEQNILTAPSFNSEEPIVSRQHGYAIFIYGLAMTSAVISIELVSWYWWHLPQQLVNNMAFYTLTLVQLWNVFNIPEASVSFFRNEVTRNKYIWMSLLLSVLIMVIAWTIVPVREALSLSSFNLKYFVAIVLFSLLPTLLIQLLKRKAAVVW